MSQVSADSFRDSLYNVDTEGRRIGFYPRKPKGPLYRARTIVSIILLAVLFVVPWIRIGGEPMMLFDIPGRKFIILGQIFWPQDLLLAAITFITFIVSIVLFTVIYGRVWCGWACPQTIFLEMVFRKIDYLIEGDSHAQKRLVNAPWTADKIRKRVMKHSIFLLISFLVANTLLAYFVGTDHLKKYVSQSPAEHPLLFGFVIAFTLIFYFVFAKLRELACIVFCPYGRLQGVFLDDKSVVISYDTRRGEPRGKIKSESEKRKPEEEAKNKFTETIASNLNLKSPAPAEQSASISPESQQARAGDCIDCKLCVAVCPTGIDIRNGTQLECVNCAACIDACDEIMEKIGRPKKLIRYASHKMITTGERFRFTPRMIAYSFVLLGLISLLTTLIIMRSDIQATITKMPGTSFKQNTEGNLENIYTIKLVNKTQKDKTVSFSLRDHQGRIKMVNGNDNPTVKGESTLAASFVVEIDRDLVTEPSKKLIIDVLENGIVITSKKIIFSGPF